MKLTVWILGLCFASVLAAAAQNLDDQYVRLYTLILQGDTYLEAKQGAAAALKFTEAEAGLKLLQASYPAWNDRVVAFRIRYVADKLKEARELAAKSPSPPPPRLAPSAPPPPASLTVDPEVLTAPLQEQIRQLQNEKTNLEARLREALSAQPAAADPKEFTKAQDRIRLLQKENEILRFSLGQEKERSAKAADPAVVEQIRAALADSTRKLSVQADVITSLRQENAVLQTQVQNNPEVTQLRVENTTLKKEVGDLKLNVGLTSAAGDIARQLAAAKTQLAAQQQLIDVVTVEKAMLEDRLRALRTAPNTPENGAPLPAMNESRVLNDKISSLEKQLAESRQSMAGNAAALEKLQQEKSTLVAKVADYALNAAMVQPPGKTAPPAASKPAPAAADFSQLTNRLDVLRARIEILEARQVPYTSDELALFQAPTKITPAEPGMARKSTRVLPGGAATLVAQAERAFNEHRLDDAEKLYQQVVQLDGRNVYTLANLAAIQLEKGELAGAEENLKRALAESPADAYSLSLMGIAQFRLNRYEEALNFLSRAAQLEPNNPETQNYLGVALSQKGLRGPAETALRKAVQISPGYGSAHHNLAVVYATAQPPSVELARYHYKKALAAGHPKNVELEKVLNARAAAAK